MSGLSPAKSIWLLARLRLLRLFNMIRGVRFGRAAFAKDRYHEIRIALETPERRGTVVTFRCYDDAIVFRYEVSKQEDRERLTIADEGTSFTLSGESVGCPAEPSIVQR